MADTIRELLIGLGFQVDDAQQQRKFVSAIEGATLRAKLLGDAIEEMARAVVGAVGQVATQFEQLFYQSQRLGASASSIRAYEYAISQLGGTVEGANSSLEDFGAFLRNTPGAAGAISRSLGIPIKDAADNAKFLLEAQQRLVGMNPAVADRYRDAYHLGDPATLFAGERPEARGFYDSQLGRDSAAGIGGDAVAKAAKFEQAWRGVWARIGTMAEGGESKLFSALTDPMQKFSDWLDKNSPQINDAIGRVSKALGDVAVEWTDDLASIILGPDKIKGLDDSTTAITHFLEAMKPLIRELQAFNDASKDWWFTKLINATAGGSMVTPLPDGPGFWASHGSGMSADDAAAAGGGLLSRAVNGVKHFFGVGDSEKGSEVTPPGAPGTYRPTYKLSEKDLSDAVVNTVAGEAQNNAKSIDAVLNNMFNRLGTHTYGPSGNLEEVARAPGQYAASPNVPARAAEAELIRSRIRAIAAGQLPDNTNGSNEYRAAWYSGPWGWLHAGSQVVGGNRFAYNPKGGIGPYAAFQTPHETMPSRPVTPTPEHHWGPWHAGGTPSGPIIPDPARLGPPIGKQAWETGHIWRGLNDALPHHSPISGASRSVHSTVNNTIHVTGADPQSTAAMVGVHLDRTPNDIARNLQGAHQ